MYGYTINCGYKGRMPDGRWLLFPTESEYIALYNEEMEES